MSLDDLLRETIREIVREELEVALKDVKEELTRGRGAWYDPGSTHSEGGGGREQDGDA